MGGIRGEEGYAITVDSDGNVYVAGYSGSAWGSPISDYTGGLEAFVTKLDRNGMRLWHTFLGNADRDWAYAISVDKTGNIYVAGESSGTWGNPINNFSGGRDAFVAKLNNKGELQWNTFLGGNDFDYGFGIALDNVGNVYVTGFSYAAWGTPVNDFTGGAYDAFAAKLNGNGVLQWNTFLGGTGGDEGEAIAVDKNGKVYVAGGSDAAWGSPINTYTEGYDAFAAQLDENGVMLWNTFLGGTGSDFGLALALDVNSNLYLTGDSSLSWGSPVNSFTAGRDICTVKLNSNGVIQWHTFLGGDDNDRGNGIAVDDSGNVYVGGYSYAAWGSPVTAFAGTNDALIVQLNNSGVLQWHTFLGGSDSDYGRAVAIDEGNNVYITGSSRTNWGSPVNAHAGGDEFDAFAAMFQTYRFPWSTFLPAILDALE